MSHPAETIQRRQLLKLLAGLFALPVCAGHSVQAIGAPAATGCLLTDSAASRALLSQSRLSAAADGEGLESTGNPRFDRALGIMLADMAGRFRVRPGFGFYDDADEPNALALTGSRFSHSQGTVLFGRKMLAKSLSGEYGDWFVLGICAHEFGHIVQYHSDYFHRLTAGLPTGKTLELHADFLSGYYLGLRAADYPYSPAELLALGHAWETLGDSQYTSPTHHGTPEERLGAIEFGFKFARERPEFGIGPACEVGARYLGA